MVVVHCKELSILYSLIKKATHGSHMSHAWLFLFVLCSDDEGAFALSDSARKEVRDIRIVHNLSGMIDGLALHPFVFADRQNTSAV